MRPASSQFSYGREKNRRGHLSDELVANIKWALYLGARHREVAEKYGVSMSQVAHISAGYTYWWVN